MEKLRILLSSRENAECYEDAVKKAGAEPTMRYMPDLDMSYDGLILCGGPDIDPALYGEDACGAVEIDYARDAREIALIEGYIAAGKPIFGICRGQQLLNAYFGGSLYQHLSDTDLHRQGMFENIATHEVVSERHSIVGRLLGERFTVNSIHHQAVKVPGEGFVPTAFHAGGCIEAIEHVRLPIFCVQWHPEQLTEDSAATQNCLPLFTYFLDLCREAKK